MDKQVLIEAFVKNFVVKERRDRCIHELLHPKKRLKFTDELNHNWEKIFALRYFTYLDSSNNNYTSVKNSLGMTDEVPCYLISDVAELDDSLLSFRKAFAKAEFATFGTLIINTTADRCFLTTEAGTPTHKLIGMKQ